MTNALMIAFTVGAVLFTLEGRVARADEPPQVAAATEACRGDALGAVIRSVEKSSVNVRTHVTTGSGFAVAGGLIVTDFDLVYRPQGLRLVGPDGKEVEATIVAVDRAHHIAVLRP